MRKLLIVTAALVAACNPSAPAEAPTAAEAPAAAHHEGHAGHEGQHAEATRPADGVTSPGGTLYGTEIDVVATLPAAELLASPAEHVDRAVAVQGKVTEVCQKAGCWMVVSAGDQHMRVTMKDHAFAVPKDGAGADCTVYGHVRATPVDPDTVAHYASETREGGVVPEQGQAGVVYSLEASGVTMLPITN